MRAATEEPLPAGQAQHPPQASGRSVLILLVLCGALLAINSPAQSFMAHDEGYYAQQARMMLAAGDWITQQWWGTLIYDRANGIQWLVALSQGLFGFGEIASRLPAMIGSLGSVLLLYSIARRIGPEPVALLAAAILAVTPIFMQASKLATQDVPLVFTELLAIWALLRAEEGRRGFAALAGIAFGLGFAIKSFMMLPAAAAMAPYLLWEHRRHRHLTNPWLWLGVLAGLLPTVAWLGLSYVRHGWFPIEAYFGKLLFLAGADFHNVGPFYYLWNVPANAFPWSLLAIGGAFVVWRDKAYRRRALVIGFPLVLFVELTSFTTRAWYYALQLLPMMSILAAACLLWLAGAYARRARLPLVLTLMMAAAGALALAAVPVAMLAGIDPLPPALSPLRFVIMATGLGFLAPLAMLLADRRAGERHGVRWAWAWLAGPFLAIAGLFATGLWGNYTPASKMQLTTGPIGEAMRQGPVAMVLPPPASTEKPVVLISLYMPQPGRSVADAAGLQPGEIAWVRTTALSSAPAHDVIGAYEDWSLIRIH